MLAQPEAALATRRAATSGACGVRPLHARLAAAHRPRQLSHAAVLQLRLAHPLDVLRRRQGERIEVYIPDHALKMLCGTMPEKRGGCREPNDLTVPVANCAARRRNARA